MGTLATVLAGKKIKTFKDFFEAVVTGDIEDVNGVLKITRINVSYWLKLPKDKRAEAKEALEAYLTLCPGAQSIIGCIDITHELTMEDLTSVHT